MSFQVVIHPPAARDIKMAARFLFERSRSSAVAQGWARGIRAKIASLKTNPLRCPVDVDSVFYGEEVRALLYGKRFGTYRVLFAVRGDVVHVLTVRHAARPGLAEELGHEGEEDEPPTVAGDR